MDGVDVSKFLRHVELTRPTARIARQRVRHTSRFVCVDEWWLTMVFKVAIKHQSPGPVAVGLVLWQQYWLNGKQQPLKLTMLTLNKFGLKRHFARKWLAVLEQAGLIKMQRFSHRSPLISIVAEEQDYESKKEKEAEAQA
jgi:hypothetical protein